MLDEIKKKDSISDHVKMGFFDYSDLSKMLDNVKVDKQYSNHGTQIALQLAPILNKASLEHGVRIKDIFERVFRNFQTVAQKGKLEDQMQELILTDMDTIVTYQLKMKECWSSFRSPMEIKSILGLVDDYRFTNHILENQKYDNPAINYSFYE